MRWEFSVLAEGRHIFGRSPKPKLFRAGRYKDLTETGNRTRKVSSTLGRVTRSSGPGARFSKVQPRPQGFSLKFFKGKALGTRLSKVPIINGPGKLFPFTL